MDYNFAFRIRIIVACTFLCALVIVARLYHVQILYGEVYEKKAQKQYLKPSLANMNRGSIFFTEKNGDKISVATIKEGYTVSINPKSIKDADQVYEALSEYIEIDKEIFLDKVMKKDNSYFELGKRLESQIGQSINALNLEGVFANKENWRIYPADFLSSHTIGITGLDKNNVLAGRYGLESYYEKILSRKTISSNINFFAELFSNIKKTVFSEESREGDLISSIEPTVASYLEKTLSDTQDKWKSDSIGGIIMDPNNGEIYAMANFPTFNPNDLSNIKDAKIFSNPLVESSYEMGSIIKPLTMAVGLDSQVITIDSTYDDKGFLVLNGRKISNFDGKARGVVPVQEILSQSLNIGAATIALRAGADTISRYFLSFGLGDKTGIEQPNEQKGLVNNLSAKRDIEIATASYGQGISMTPIQTIRALSTLANGGILIKPHIIKSIEYIDGHSEIIETDGVRVLKKESVDDVTSMLINVVDKALNGGKAKMENYSIAAKTGTAQIADPVNGGYYKDRYLHSFFGYFPAYNPKFIIFLYHIYPKNVEYASATLTDPFMQMTKFLINYYEIPPDR